MPIESSINIDDDTPLLYPQGVHLGNVRLHSAYPPIGAGTSSVEGRGTSASLTTRIVQHMVDAWTDRI